LIQTF